MKSATKGQKDLLFKYYETVEQEKKYANEINKIYDPMGSGIYSPDVFSVTVCADEDDAGVISMGLKQELRDVREQKLYMKKAVELECDT